MLPIACVIAFLPLSVQFSIPVKNGRASRLVSLMRGAEGQPMVPPELRLLADDPAGVIRVEGTAEEISSVRQFVKVLDVPRPMMQLKMHIESPADKASYDVSTSLRANKRWRMSDEDTGITVVLNPRLNGDRTVTLSMLLQYPGGQREEIVRLKSGQKLPIELGDQKALNVWQAKDGSYVEAAADRKALPKVTFQVTLPSR